MTKRFLALFLFLVFVFPFSANAADLAEADLTFEDLDLDAEEETELSVYEIDGSRIVTVTCTGDFTVGGDNYHKKGKKFYQELEKYDDNLNFTMSNVRDILKHDDLTIVNFEGTFTDTKYVPDRKRNNDFLFNISPSYSYVLPDNYIEAVTLENNHIMDHGDEGLEDTKTALRSACVIYSTSEELGEFWVDDTYKIAILSYLCIDRYDKPVGGYDNLYDKVAADIRQAKQEYGYPIVIVAFHWGNELDYTPTERQIKMGRLAVDSGADLVIGHHSHRINPIEEYKGVYICYSLGNFCFSGNDAPKDMNSYLFQTRFRISKTGAVTNTGFRIIPIRITSLKDKNNYVPTPITDDMKIEGIINTLKDNGRKLEYAVADYPLEWKE